MEVEDEKTQLFFKETLPLDHLNDSQLREVVKISQTAYRKRDHIMSLKSDFIYLIRKGAVQISGENQTLKELIGEHIGLVTNQSALYTNIELLKIRSTIAYPKRLFLIFVVR